MTEYYRDDDEPNEVNETNEDKTPVLLFLANNKNEEEIRATNKIWYATTTENGVFLELPDASPLSL